MKKFYIIITAVFLFIIAEFLLFNLLGKWFKPNFMLLLVIFFNLYFGIRYGILAAFLAGLFLDSFASGFFGINIFSFILCAYLTTLLKRYIYQVGSDSSRMILISIILILNVSIHYVLYSIFTGVFFFDVVRFVLLPEFITTMLVATYTFHILKKCVSRFFV